MFYMLTTVRAERGRDTNVVAKNSNIAAETFLMLFFSLLMLMVFSRARRIRQANEYKRANKELVQHFHRKGIHRDHEFE